MIRIEFSETEIKALQQEKRPHPDPRVRRRMETLHLKALGYRHQEIGQIVGITQKTLRDYLKLYQAGGIAALKEAPLLSTPECSGAGSSHPGSGV